MSSLPVHGALDDRVVQRDLYVSGLIARQQPTVNVRREEVHVTRHVHRFEVLQHTEISSWSSTRQRI